MNTEGRYQEKAPDTVVSGALRAAIRRRDQNRSTSASTYLSGLRARPSTITS